MRNDDELHAAKQYFHSIYIIYILHITSYSVILNSISSKRNSITSHILSILLPSQTFYFCFSPFLILFFYLSFVLARFSFSLLVSFCHISRSLTSLTFSSHPFSQLSSFEISSFITCRRCLVTSFASMKNVSIYPVTK